MDTARQLSLDALCKMHTNEAFSNIIIDKLLSASTLNARDRAFASKLFYGVLERKITLDHCVSKYSKLPLKKLSPQVLNILRMGIYQLVFMDSVPDSAAVNESVKLVYTCRQQSAKGFVNAVLRSFLRDDKKIILPNKNTDYTRYLGVKYSCPEPLIQKWFSEYGEKNTELILKSSLGTPPLFIRVNTNKTDLKTLAAAFSEKGIKVYKSRECENCLAIAKSGGIEHTEEYKNGMFYVQDLASQLLCGLVNPQEGETVLDMCAAPGGKSFTLAQYMKNSGRIFAFDIHPSRVKLISDGAKRLGLDCITAAQNNAAVYNGSLPKADKVLCDVPCSGLGVIRRKPEIKYKSPSDFYKLCDIQYKILSESSKLVKTGGILIYSTCTLSRSENDLTAEKFLNDNPDFSPLIIEKYNDYKHTFLPGEYSGDGFFIAVFEKVNR